MTSTGLVLAGGGARGAYEVGVVRGIIDVLGGDAHGLFDVFTGTSVGAINATFLAASAQLPNLGIDRLEAIWRDLTLLRDVDIDLLGPMRGQALLHGAPLKEIVGDNIPWDQLHENVQEGLVRAVMVAALRMDTGQTTVFAETAPGQRFVPSRDPRRLGAHTDLAAIHVLASAAIPLIFQPRMIDGAPFVDGGLRFNTPLAPALRSDVDRLVVISVRHEQAHAPVPVYYRNGKPRVPLGFLVGKMIAAIMLDPVEYDMQVLRRVNVLLDVIEGTVGAEGLETINKAMEEVRGKPYRRVKTLFFRPSQDLGAMARQHMREEGLRLGHGLGARARGRVIRRLIGPGSDLGSFLLFDGPFANRLIDLGHQDAVKKATAIKVFFGRM
jgi:NTE family protein